MKAQIDYFHQYPVNKVRQYGNQPWQWEILMEGGGVIKNHDKRRTAAPNVEGTVLVKTEVSEPDKGGISTTLFFSDGTQVASGNITASAPGYDDPDEEETDPLPPDPSSERVVDGPVKP